VKCDFCKRDEVEIKKIFEPLFKSFSEKIEKLEINIRDIRQIYPIENGFISENFDKVDKINEAILKMKISTVLLDIDNFIKLDPNIQLLYIYIDKHRPEISKEKTLEDLVVLYKKEPSEERLNNAKETYVNKKNNLIRQCNEIKGKYDTFSEIEIDYNIPLHIFELKDKTLSHIINDKNNSVMNIPNKMKLCPYCFYLFENMPKEIQKAEENTRKVTLNKIRESYDHSSLKEFDCWKS
jgi:hypothetical protein